jgi:hypothetical protein
MNHPESKDKHKRVKKGSSVSAFRMSINKVLNANSDIIYIKFTYGSHK